MPIFAEICVIGEHNTDYQQVNAFNRYYVPGIPSIFLDLRKSGMIVFTGARAGTAPVGFQGSYFIFGSIYHDREELELLGILEQIFATLHIRCCYMITNPAY